MTRKRARTEHPASYIVLNINDSESSLSEAPNTASVPDNVQANKNAKVVSDNKEAALISTKRIRRIFRDFNADLTADCT